MDLAPEAVRKLDATKRQLREAIHLFFDQRDLIAVHTLAAAALQVYADVGKRRGVPSMLKHGLYIREERKKEWLALLSTAQNFFKHADSDPDAILDFRPANTTFFLLDCVQLQAQLEGRITAAGSCFLVWFYAAYPDVLTNEPFRTFVKATAATGADPQDFPLFFKLLQQSEASESLA